MASCDQSGNSRWIKRRRSRKEGGVVEKAREHAEVRVAEAGPERTPACGGVEAAGDGGESEEGAIVRVARNVLNELFGEGRDGDTREEAEECRLVPTCQLSPLLRGQLHLTHLGIRTIVLLCSSPRAHRAKEPLQRR
mgnify:CR=1 FL=1